MLLLDVNVLVYAFREDVPQHEEFRTWLDTLVNGDQAFGISDLVLSGFLRIVTHPKIFDPPTPLTTALEFVQVIRAQPNCVPISAGPRHWSVFVQLCRQTGAAGNLIPDAFHAALAIESGTEWVTTDRDFDRFPGLRHRKL